LTERGFPLRSVVREHRLDNGLTVLAVEDRRSPVVAIVTHVSAGYFDDTDDEVGISHVLEHMFFKGTARRSPGDLGRETKSLGGLLNAGTSYDRTSYYTVVPSTGLEQALDMQADALLNSAIDAGELERELRVIIQEAKRKLDRPSAVARETLYETMFDHHRMRRWRIGTESGLERLTRDDVVTFYRAHYRARNVVLCIAGDIDADATLRMVERYYADLDSGEFRPDRGPDEPPRAEFRFRDIEGDITQTYLEFGWRTPGILDPDSPYLDLGAMVLGQGRASRLYRGVRERGFVTHIGAATYTPGDLGLFAVMAVGRPDEASDALDAIHGVLEATRNDGIADTELERARNILEARLVARFETVQGQASLLAEWHALGGWRLFEDHWNRLMQAERSEVERALRDYVSAETATVLVYRPAGTDRLAWAPRSGAVPFSADYDVDVPALPVPAASAADADVDLESVEDGVRLYRANGSRIVVLSRREVPLVAMAVAFMGGASDEDAACAGLTGLVARTSIKGTARRSAARLAEESEALGGAIGPAVGSDALQWTIAVPSRHAETALDLLVDVVRNATFPEPEFERERKAALSAAKQLRDDMYAYPMRLLFEAAFESDPYGFRLETHEAAVERATRAEVVAWHARLTAERSPMLLVTGDTDANIVYRAAHLLGPTAGEPTDEAEPAGWPDGPRRRIVERDTAQSALALGFRGPDRNHPDALVLKVLAAAVAGLGGRLFEELRSRRSLAYTVAARPIARLRGGAFVAYIATSPDREEEARAALIEELLRLTVEPLPADDVERAKRYLIGARQIQLQTNRAQLAELGAALLLGSGLEEVRNYEERVVAVTPDTIREAAARWFDGDRMVEGMVRGSGKAR
jgi:zinc protease